jgi:hypothetical protein
MAAEPINGRCTSQPAGGDPSIFSHSRNRIFVMTSSRGNQIATHQLTVWNVGDEMGNVYAVKKRMGRWVLCSGEDVILDFESYDEAIETVRGGIKAIELCKRKASSQERPLLKVREFEHVGMTRFI